MKIKYIPRHKRIGVNLNLPSLNVEHEVLVEVPVLDDDGNQISVLVTTKSVPAREALGKYRVGDFKLSNLIKAGVPLKIVNLNRSLGFQISELENVCKGLESSEQFVNRVIAERKEKESWLQPSINEDEK